MDFLELHRKFENKNTDLFLLQKQKGFSKYILVRSLDKAHLLSILNNHSLQIPEKSNIDVLYQKVCESKITIQELIDFIRKEYPSVKKNRQDQEKYLPNILADFTNVKCGVRNDNLNDLVSGLVRDKSIETKVELDSRIQDLITSNIQEYIYWQYYNQASSDLLEHIFNDHPRIIPTLRKIKYVDFLIEIEGEIIPFDLKVTHLSESYYDLLKCGLNTGKDTADDYYPDNDNTEIKEIKDFYKSFKKKYNFPNYGQLTKLELINKLSEYAKENDSIDKFLHKIYKQRSKLVEMTEKDQKKACWWNYKNQGERLFKNNNRFYVFLAYQESYEDPRPLKGNLKGIKAKVDHLLNNLTKKDLMDIHYKYEKDKTFNGEYQVNSLSIMFVK